jgi:glycosyltransferase involved in cell wall biosynthesis
VPEFSNILMLVNWDVHRASETDTSLQSPNALRNGEKYWFFKYWPNQSVRVDVLDFCRLPVINYVERWWLKFYVTQALRALPRIGRYDLILSHGAQSGVLMAFLRSLVGVKMPPHVIIDVGCFNGGRSRKLEILPLKQAAKSVTGVISHNSFQQDYYRENLPSLAEKCRFVPFGTDPQFFKPMDLQTEDYIVSIGYIKRDWETLIKAFERLEGKTKLKIIGVPEKNELELSPGMEDRVECKPYIPIGNLKEEIAKARFVVIPLPYYKYSFGQMTLLQSMSMQKAVIVTDVPGVADYVEHGHNAMLFQPKDWRDLKSKMETLLQNPEMARSLARNARESVMTKFNEERLAQELYHAINQLCGSGN